MEHIVLMHTGSGPTVTVRLGSKEGSFMIQNNYANILKLLSPVEHTGPY